MNIKKAIFIGVISLGLLSACGEKKAKEEHGHSHAEEEVTELVKEASKTEIEDARNIKEDSLRKVDSLQQVKAHGHAH